MSASAPTPAPGTYKFTVKSVDQAVALIREKLGPNARVLSVRSVEAGGLKKFFTAPRLEVVAQVDAALGGEPATVLTAGAIELSHYSAAATETSAPRQAAPRAQSSQPGLTGLLRRSGITETALNRLQSGANWN